VRDCSLVVATVKFNKAFFSDLVTVNSETNIYNRRIIIKIVCEAMSSLNGGMLTEKVQKTRYLFNWKVVAIILAIYSSYVTFFPILTHSTVYMENLQRAAKLYSDDTYENQNATCAKLLLKWCLQNRMNLSNCSWTIGTFRNHFYAMAALISRPFPESADHNKGLAFVRLGDGEMMLMFGIAVESIDPWLWPGGRSRLGQDLRALLRIPKHQYNSFSPVYYGIYDANIICSFHEILTMIHQHPKYLTYTNLFVNTNYPATQLLHRSLIRDERKRIILIINDETSPTKLTELKEWTAEIILYPHNGSMMWEGSDFRDQAIRKIVTVATRYRNRLFAFSVGPLSRVLIHYAWLENPYNRYIDFGSTFDQMIKGTVTRPYQSNTDLNQDPSYIINFNVTKNQFDVRSVN
jgi:hypothetical protein